MICIFSQSFFVGKTGWEGGGGFAHGHTFGVRVDGAAPRGSLRFLSLTAFPAEGCGIALSGDEYEVSVMRLAL